MASTTAPQQRPPGYPEQYEQDLLLSDGRRVHVRPAVPEDRAESVARVRALASEQDLQDRWMAQAGHLTDEAIGALVIGDYVQRFPLVAIALDGPDAGRMVAGAMYEQVHTVGVPDIANATAMVAPSYRGVGLAEALLLLVLRRGREVGMAGFTSMFRPGNAAARRLAQKLGARTSDLSDRLCVAMAGSGEA